MRTSQQKHKRIAALLLVLCVLIATFAAVGCGGKKVPPIESGTASGSDTRKEAKTEEQTEAPDDSDDLDDSYDFDRDYVILSRESTAYEFESDSNASTDIVANAVYSRNTAVEERANVTVKVEKLAGDWEGKDKMGEGATRGGNYAFEGRVRNDALSGFSAYDLIATHAAYLANLALEGLGKDLNAVDHIDLTKRWWNEAYFEECSYRDAIYLMVSDMAYTMYEYMQVVFFNEEMANDLDLGDLYGLALDGGWTYTKLKEYTKEVESNPDAGDSQKYGLLTNAHAHRAWANAVEANMMQKDSDGKYYYPATLNETALNRMTDYIEFVRGLATNSVYTQMTWGDEKWAETKMFANGRGLFYMQMLGESATLKTTMDDDYGILPFPKWDDTQLEYHSNSKDSGTAVMIPANVKDIESTGIITELMALYGYEKITGAYYEKVLKYQSFNDPRCIQILELIKKTANYSLQHVYTNCLDGPNSLIISCILDSSKELVSYYESKRANYDTTQFYEDLDAAYEKLH